MRATEARKEFRMRLDGDVDLLEELVHGLCRRFDLCIRASGQFLVAMGGEHP